MAEEKSATDRFVHEHLDQIEVIGEDGKPVGLEELMKRKGEKKDESRADAVEEMATARRNIVKLFKK